MVTEEWPHPKMYKEGAVWSLTSNANSFYVHLVMCLYESFCVWMVACIKITRSYFSLCVLQYKFELVKAVMEV